MAPSKTDITRMNKGQLESALKELGLSHVGTRPEMKNRLVDFHYGAKKNQMEVEKCPPAVAPVAPVAPVKAQNGIKAPSKSAIKAMKKKDLQEKLAEFCLDTSGDKTKLTERLENYYRPLQPVLPVGNEDNAENNDVKAIIQSPSKSQIEAMSETEIKHNLGKVNLSTEGCMIELIKRLENYYRPIKNDIPQEVANKPPKKYSATVTMSVIPYLGQTIGIDIDTMEVYEKKGDNWHETGLMWNMETNSYA